MCDNPHKLSRLICESRCASCPRWSISVCPMILIVAESILYSLSSNLPASSRNCEATLSTAASTMLNKMGNPRPCLITWKSRLNITRIFQITSILPSLPTFYCLIQSSFMVIGMLNAFLASIMMFFSLISIPFYNTYDR